MRRACIDIGSNTTRLLVADCDGGELVECRQARAFTLLGRSLDASGAIPAHKLSEVLAAVAEQHAIAREMGATEVRCVGTAAVRRATNSEVLVRLVRDACDGLELHVLSDAEEARLAFLGAAWAVDAAEGAALAVVDAGGGSSEIVVGEAPGHVRWWVSLPLGSGDVTHRWLHSDPPTAAELIRARELTAETFAAVGSPPPAGRVVAVGGSATSLCLLAGPVIGADAIEGLLETLRRFSAVEFARNFGIDVQRARLLAGGLLILAAISELFGAPLELGRGGLREGLLLDSVAGA